MTDAPAPIGHNRPPGKFRGTCTECGSDFRAHRAHADFCGHTCRLAFNNRRRDRGAELYDLVMVTRHERGTAKLLGVWKLICRLTSEYKRQDDAKRAGRKSWRPAKAIIERHPHLLATVTNIQHQRRA